MVYNPRDMICDKNTCGREYPDEEINEQCDTYVDDELVKRLKYEKRKLVQLVRQQMQRFQETEYSLPSTSDESKRLYKLDLQDTFMNEELSLKEGTNKEANVTPRTLYIPSSTPIRQPRSARRLGKIRRRICALVSVTGVIVLMLLVYGVYFRLYLCNNGQACVTSFQYTHAKHALF